MSFDKNSTLVGMNFLDTSVPTAGAYFAEGKIQAPRLASGPGQGLGDGKSSVVVTVSNLTGPVTLYTGLPGADGFYVAFSAAANDVIRVALTSVDPDDTPLNAVKCEISIGSGQ